MKFFQHLLFTYVRGRGGRRKGGGGERGRGRRSIKQRSILILIQTVLRTRERFNVRLDVCAAGIWRARGAKKRGQPWLSGARLKGARRTRKKLKFLKKLTYRSLQCTPLTFIVYARIASYVSPPSASSLLFYFTYERARGMFRRVLYRQASCSGVHCACLLIGSDRSLCLLARNRRGIGVLAARTF